MKIVHVVSTFPPYKGGMGNVAYEEVKRLFKNHHVVVITPENKKESILGRDYKIDYIKPVFKYGNAFFIPQVVKKLKKADIIHLHWPFIGGAEAVLLYKKLGKLNAKLVVQYHMDLIDSGLRGILFKIYKSLFSDLMVKQADKILVSSLDYIQHSQIKKYYKKYKNKFKKLALGVDTKRFKPKKVDNFLKPKMEKTDNTLLLVGGLDRAHYFKGVDIAIKALSILNKDNYKLIIVGEGELKKQFKKLSKKLKVEKNVIFTGRVSDKKLVDYYNISDAVILPSTSSSEAFGLVLLEGMACSKPILTSNLPGPRSLVDENGYVMKVGDPKDVACKIDKLFANSVKEFSQKSLELVRKKYQWQGIVDNLENIYENL